MINIGKKHRKILLEGKKKKKNSNSKIKFYTTKKAKNSFTYPKNSHTIVVTGVDKEILLCE